ncbi:alpha/beta fold hydrolase [Rhizobium sp. FY34]|uniref:alpha/beta fold hydrolase n=1 Tax=Rhizobium sp. FY34 TaxID=2562309 RepID=UPI0010C12383|nr:alpha/beta fold hydrolase [Rhizobium sp. FY34]
MLHAAPGDTAVLICPPWGYEALCAYKSLRILADQLAERGYPVLRFDYPATGNSSVAPDNLSGIEDWRISVCNAAADLQQLTGASRVVLLGLGLGTLLARLASPDIPSLYGLALLGPVNDGRRYLRELCSWSAMINESIGLAPASTAVAEPDIGPAIAGFEMPSAIALTLKAINAKSVPLSSVMHLIAQRSGFVGDQDLADTLKAAGTEIRLISFEGFEGLLGDPTSARTPKKTWQAVGDWMSKTFPMRPAYQPALPDRPVRQSGHGFEEEFLRFGANDQLFGVLCEPDDLVPVKDRQIYIIINSGFDPQVGWARSTTDQARALARAGIASLRMDTADIGDSPAYPDSPAMVLYSQAQIDDVTPAIDCLEARGYRQILLTGRCAGAYVALNAAVADHRVKGAVIVNLQRLVWDPDEDVEEAVQNAFRSFDNYKSRMLQLDTLKRIVSGDINVLRVARSILRRLSGRLGVKLAPVSFGLTKYARLRREVLSNFALLRQRQTAVALVYSADDGGLDELATYFGRNGQMLCAYPNTSITVIADADHNMTPKAARAQLLALMTACAGENGRIRSTTATI